MFAQPDLLHTRNHTISQTLAGSHDLTWLGPAKLTLTNANYSGPTFVKGGELELQDALGFQSDTTVSNGVLSRTGVSSDSMVSVDLVLNGNATFRHATTGSGAWTVMPASSAPVQVNGTGNRIEVANTVFTNNNLFFDAGLAGSGDLTVQAVVGGVGTQRAGAVINAAGSYTGNLTVDTGVLYLASAAARALQNVSDLDMTNGAIIASTTNWARSASSNIYLPALDIADTSVAFELSTSMHVGLGNGSGTYSGDVRGTANFNKLGTGTQILNGVHTSTSGTLMGSDGILELTTGYTKTTTNNVLYAGSLGGVWADGAGSLTGTVRVTGGSFTTSYNGANAIRVGATANYPGILEIISGSVTASGGASGAYIGELASGTLNMSGGSLSTGTGGITFGQNAAGTGIGMISNGTVTTTGAIWSGNLGTGNVTQTGGDVSCGGAFLLANQAGSNGTWDISAGTLDVGTVLYVAPRAPGVLNISGTAVVTPDNITLGSHAAAGNGTVNMSGGTLTTTNASTGFNVIGGQVAAGTGIWNHTGGTATLAGITYMTNTVGSSGTLNVSGGTFRVNNTLSVGTRTGSSIATVSGTGLLDVVTLHFGLAGGNGVVNLNGGTAEVNNILRSSGSGTVNFNSGTLRAGATFTAASTGMTYNVQNGGALIDTNGFNVTFNSVFNGVGSGGLTKQGAGTLFMTGTGTYTGVARATIGTISFAAIPTTSTFRVDVAGAAPTVSNSGRIAFTVNQPNLGAKTLNEVITPTAIFGLYDVLTWTDNSVLAQGTNPSLQLNGTPVASGQIVNVNGHDVRLVETSPGVIGTGPGSVTVEVLT